MYKTVLKNNYLRIPVGFVDIFDEVTAIGVGPVTDADIDDGFNADDDDDDVDMVDVPVRVELCDAGIGVSLVRDGIIEFGIFDDNGFEVFSELDGDMDVAVFRFVVVWWVSLPLNDFREAFDNADDGDCVDEGSKSCGVKYFAYLLRSSASVTADSFIGLWSRLLIVFEDDGVGVFVFMPGLWDVPADLPRRIDGCCDDESRFPLDPEEVDDDDDDRVDAVEVDGIEDNGWGFVIAGIVRVVFPLPVVNVLVAPIPVDVDDEVGVDVAVALLNRFGNTFVFVNDSRFFAVSLSLDTVEFRISNRLDFSKSLFTISAS